MEYITAFIIFVAKYLLAPMVAFIAGNYIQSKRYQRQLCDNFNNRLYNNVIIYVNQAWACCSEFMRITNPLVEHKTPICEINPKLFNDLLNNIYLALGGIQKFVDLNELDNAVYSNIASRIKPCAIQLYDWIESNSGVISADIAGIMVAKLYPALESLKKCLLTDVHGWQSPV